MATLSLSSAINDFHRARHQAMVKEIMSRFTGEAVDLLSFEDVRRMLKAKGSSERGLQEVPLKAIVGSVNRYEDFTRDFLPRGSVMPERWARVEIAINDLAGLDAIEVYQIGEVYFVKDGNHRVSVARRLGATHIQAYVTKIRTRVTLTPDVKPDDLILIAEYAEFLERTGIDDTRPESELTVSAPGQYAQLLEHIEVHRYYMGIELQRDIPYEEAVAHWYDAVYLPIRQLIWSKGILRDFPGRTEADLYLWIADHRAALEEAYGRDIRAEDAASDLSAQFSTRPERIATRLGSKIREARLSPGGWRKEKLAANGEHLFSEILVPVSGQEGGWFALDHAILLARREEAHLHGLHVYETQQNLRHARTAQEEFEHRCHEAGVYGKLALAQGENARKINEQARWNDLVVVNLAYPPSPRPLAALSSGFRKLIQHCPRPVLAVPCRECEVSGLSRPLLAYDGSPKADEALFIATYMAAKWDLPLVIMTVFDNQQVPPETLMKASLYLEEHGVQAELVKETPPVAEKILQVVNERDCDLLLMGGYGHNPMLDVVLGNVVDQVLRESDRPVLICR